jgi:hypothetical protein
MTMTRLVNRRSRICFVKVLLIGFFETTLLALEISTVGQVIFTRRKFDAASVYTKPE